MTDADVLKLIQSSYPGLTAASREQVSDMAIAETISNGLTKQVSTLVGYGRILDILGPLAGAQLLGSIEAAATSNTSPAYWGMKLLDSGTLDLSMPSTQAQFAAMVQVGMMTAAQQTALINYCTVPIVVNVNQVSNVLNSAGF